MYPDYNFLLMILTLVTFLALGCGIAFFCIRRISFHEEEIRKNIPQKKKILAKRNIIIMKINLVGAIIWIVFFIVRAIISIVNYLK